MKKLAKDIHGCDDCPLNGNDCNPDSWDGREGACHSWNGDEIIQPYMYSVAAELHETKAASTVSKIRIFFIGIYAYARAFLQKQHDLGYNIADITHNYIQITKRN